MKLDLFLQYFRQVRAFMRRIIQKHPYLSATTALAFFIWLFCLPSPLFNDPVSVVLEDREGELLGARIATDGQWRFPAGRAVPEKYAKALTTFEDKRFWYHPGVDPVGVCRALWGNLKNGRVVSGGSTITMQVIRMARLNPSRTVWQKIVEIFMATRLEAGYSKKKILSLYAAHAPFGGNVVGLEAAAWRYYGKKPELLSWAEAAMLAVLPNSPALIHPGRNRNALLQKRNNLLLNLQNAGYLDADDCELARSEPLPESPLPLPQRAPHLLDRLSLAAGGKTNRFKTTIDADLQERLTEILARRQAIYQGNDIHNLAAVVIHVPTGEVRAYLGNVPGAGKAHGESVDVLAAPRSTGSILKPYLYALALESGDILPRSLLTDVPTQLGQYKPENYYETYDGAVASRRALIRSLNVPFVLLLKQYGLEKFHFNLKRLGLTTIQKAPDHYGLSLILGGAEANLLDITNVYACMGRTLGNFYDRNGRYDPLDFRPPVFIMEDKPANAHSKNNLQKETDLLSAGAIWHTFEAMQEVERPVSAGEWAVFRAGRPVAWKTGTSFGFRDAWAAGVTPEYAIGVWVGNADGEGRPGLIGVEMAAPVLFEIVNILPAAGRWFDPPYDGMVPAAVCRQSGFRAGEYCEKDTTWVPKSGLTAPVCVYHQLLHLDATGQWQVNSECESPTQMQHQPWFVLEPLQEFYYRSKHPDYIPPPPFRADCLAGVAAEASRLPMQLIYPKHPARIYVPVELNGTLGKTVFQVAHRNADTPIFWHLDGVYVTTTITFHQVALQPAVGPHILTLVDKDGNRLVQKFEVLGK